MTSINESQENTFELEELESLGLSSYEAKVYYNMLPLGAKRARKISDLTKIPFGRIYDVLSSLKDKGLIKEIEGTRPKKYLANDPNIAMKKLIDLKSVEFSKMKQRAIKVEEKLKNWHPDTNEDSPFWSVGMDEESMELHEQKLLEAENEALIYLNMIGHYDSFSKAEEDSAVKNISYLLVEKNVKIKMILGAVSEEEMTEELKNQMQGFQAIFQNLEIRYTTIDTNTFDVLDKEKVLIKLQNPIIPNEYITTIFLWQKSFAKQLESIFNSIWDRSSVI